LSHYRLDDADVACAALLRDTVEDHAGRDVKDMIARQLDKADGRLAVLTGEDGGVEVRDGERGFRD
jgi:hypothetical protein